MKTKELIEKSSMSALSGLARLTEDVVLQKNVEVNSKIIVEKKSHETSIDETEHKKVCISISKKQIKTLKTFSTIHGISFRELVGNILEEYINENKIEQLIVENFKGKS